MLRVQEELTRAWLADRVPEAMAELGGSLGAADEWVLPVREEAGRDDAGDLGVLLLGVVPDETGKSPLTVTISETARLLYREADGSFTVLGQEFQVEDWEAVREFLTGRLYLERMAPGAVMIFFDPPPPPEAYSFCEECDLDDCCNDPDRCCGSTNPCCGNPDPCCNNPDPCCNNPDPCCDNPDPCCDNPDPCCDDPDPCCDSGARALGVALSAVEWVPAAGTPLDANPNAGGGLRIFPGKTSPSDAQDHRKVKVRAVLNGPVVGQPVYFRVFDVDDPSATQLPVDDETLDQDNRGSPKIGSPATYLGYTTAESPDTVKFEFTVTMQPGDNFRVAAALCSDADLLSMHAVQSDYQGRVVDANNQVIPSNKITPMLTVWRKVWLELDSMGPGSDISYTGTIDEIADNSPHVGDGTAELDVPDINDDGRFEGGTMSVPASGRSYTLIDNVDVFVDDDYITDGLIVGNDLGETATVVDDDTAVLPRTPDANITVLNDKYRNCYIEFTENTATRDNNNVFVATLAWTSSALAAKGAENADLVPGPDFWVACVVSCYQSHHDASGANATTADGDPNRRYHVHGATWSSGDTEVIFGGTPGTTENVSTFYLETVVDFISQVNSGYWPGITPQPLGFMEARLNAHEIGHQFGLPDVSAAAATLMSPWDGTDREFDAAEVAEIRNSQYLESN